MIKITVIISMILVVGIQAESNPSMCKCPMLKQIDAEMFAKIKGISDMTSKKIPNFAPLDIGYGDNCTKVTISCAYPRFTRHRSSVYYTNGANLSTVRRHDLADKYSIRCNQLTGIWLSEEDSEISYIQCAYRPMLVNKVWSAIWEELVRLYRMIINVVKTNFGFAKFIVGYD
uniref:DUF2807 domain-containing protein n=1 Tax=Caenorhabditis tropicalis TaxID=1561998 RepID=A0A1I7V4C4_9PELO